MDRMKERRTCLFVDTTKTLPTRRREEPLQIAESGQCCRVHYNDTNFIEEEVTERIALGIKAYCANLKFFKSRLVTKSSKLQLYRTAIRPIVTYASQAWVLKENIIQKLLVFERKILRGIFGPTKENQTWRIKNNKELDKLINTKI